MINNKNNGFSIIELMIGVTISLLLVAAAATIWVSSKVSYGVQSDLSEIQEIGRFAATMLQREIRETGHMGCMGKMADGIDSFDEIFPKRVADLDDVPSLTRIDGQNGAGTASDSFSLGGLSTDGLGVVDDETSGNDDIFDSEFDDPGHKFKAISINATTITVEKAPKFKAGNIFGIADCSGGAFFEVSTDMDDDEVDIPLIAGTQSPGFPDDRGFVGEADSAADIAADIAAGKDPYKTHLFKFHRDTYTIEDLDNDGDTELVRRGLSGAEELLPDVENMQVLYGIDTNDTLGPDRYVTANAVSSWDSVVSLKIALLIRSTEERGSQLGAASYILLDQTINVASDKRRRKVVSAEVNIRN